MKRVVIASLLIAMAGCRSGEVLTPPPIPPRADPPVTQPRPTPVPDATPRTSPLIRVGITLDSSRTVISAPVEFEVQSVNGRALAAAKVGETWTFFTNEEGQITATSNGTTVVQAPPPLKVVPRDLSFVTIDGRTYRGQVLLLAPRAGRISAINVVDMEAYLLGVVPREMGKRPATEIEALKAQAVAARTYAIGNIGGHADQGFDYYATVLDQVYGGTADEDSIVSRAVNETRGVIVRHDGNPIFAYYSSTCGGSTSAIEDSWPTRSPLRYLRAVSDRVPGTETAYCATSNRYRWKTEWTRDQLLAILAVTLRAHTKGAVSSVRRIDDVRITARAPAAPGEPADAGRATIALKADGKRYDLRADSLRWVLRPTSGTGAILNSSRLYDVHATTDGGQVTHLTIEGGGWGHGIGMCQVGAMARARDGQSYTQILKAYYTDVTVDRLY